MVRRGKFVVGPDQTASALHKGHDPPSAGRQVPAQHDRRYADSVVCPAGLVRTSRRGDIRIAGRGEIVALKSGSPSLPPRHQFGTVLELPAQKPRADWIVKHLAGAYSDAEVRGAGTDAGACATVEKRSPVPRIAGHGFAHGRERQHRPARRGLRLAGAGLSSKGKSGADQKYGGQKATAERRHASHRMRETARIVQTAQVNRKKAAS